MLSRLPVLGICGLSNSGKTTLIEQVLPELLKKNLRVAVVKHDAHRIDVDRPGKDSDRLFKAGADVFLQGDQLLHRLHLKNALNDFLLQLVKGYDLILVEGYKHSDLPKIWLKDSKNSPPPADISRLLACYDWNDQRPRQFLVFLESWLQIKMQQQSLSACILIGGGSRRMGSPKHLLTIDGKTLLEHLTATLSSFAEQVLIAGRGTLPESLGDLPQLPDSPGYHGPLAGIISALRWQPDAAWLVVACDMPQVSAEALQWLLDQRLPGVWGVMPSLEGQNKPEPLLSLYDGRLLDDMEEAGRREIPRLGELAGHPKIIHPQPPESFSAAWNNINTRKELAAALEKHPDT